MIYVNAILLLLAGMGTFLLGCKFLSDNMEKLASKKLRRLFEKTGKNPFLGVGVGCATTAIVQSSGLTTVMVVGFVNSGIMNLFQATTLIMGANIGTTITAQIASLKSFDVAVYFMCLAGIGSFMTMFMKSDKFQTIGRVIAGLGLVFVGLELMSDSMEFVKKSDFLVQVFTDLKNPFALFAIGIIVTAIIQSSSVVTSVLISMVYSGIVIGGGGNSVLFIILGTNIGSTVVALISSIGANTNAKRAALIHLLFNTFGSILFLAVLIPWESFMASTFEVIFKHPTTQIAMFHTFFNVFCVCIFLPFASLFVRLSQTIIRDKKKETDNSILDKRLLATPSIAVDYAKQESIRMLDLAMKSIEQALTCFNERMTYNHEHIQKRNADVIKLNNDITSYLIQISASDISFENEKYIQALYSINSSSTRISDLSDNIIRYNLNSIEKNFTFSPTVKKDLNDLMSYLNQLFGLTKKSFAQGDNSWQTLIDRESSKISSLSQKMISNHIERLNSGKCNAESSGVFFSLVANLDRVKDHLKMIALATN